MQAVSGGRLHREPPRRLSVHENRAQARVGGSLTALFRPGSQRSRNGADGPLGSTQARTRSAGFIALSRQLSAHESRALRLAEARASGQLDRALPPKVTFTRT